LRWAHLLAERAAWRACDPGFRARVTGGGLFRGKATGSTGELWRQPESGEYTQAPPARLG